MSSQEAEKQDRDQKLLKFLCRHLLVFTGKYFDLDNNGVPHGTEKTYIFSGWPLKFAGRLFLVTAGHCVRDIVEPEKEKKIGVMASLVADYFGPEPTSKTPIPFKLSDQVVDYVYDKDLGLDFAVILPSLLHTALLMKNDLAPFGKAQWDYPDDLKFDGYALLGFPYVLSERSEMTIQEAALNPKGGWVRLCPTLMNVEKLEEDPSVGIPTVYPRFRGRIIPSEKVQRVGGMSGGPIFGFYWTEKKELRYYVVAIQSSQVEDRDVIYGCPVKTVMKLLNDELEREFAKFIEEVRAAKNGDDQTEEGVKS